ncbi:MAG: hypothetical protein OXF06_11055 [Bacteroidetes bacterium]|nr:hypothetical protein [Bacteroidota bacterium]MCY4225359.1 hypothetical protein [Bacteroidota bacterium]
MDKNSDLEFSRISHLLRKSGLDSDEANELTERITNMASSNVIAEIRSYTKSQDSKFDSLKSKYNFLIVIASAALTIGLAVGGWLLATGGG